MFCHNKWNHFSEKKVGQPASRVSMAKQYTWEFLIQSKHPLVDEGQIFAQSWSARTQARIESSWHDGPRVWHHHA